MQFSSIFFFSCIEVIIFFLFCNSVNSYEATYSKYIYKLRFLCFNKRKNTKRPLIFNDMVCRIIMYKSWSTGLSKIEYNFFETLLGICHMWLISPFSPLSCKEIIIWWQEGGVENAENLIFLISRTPKRLSLLNSVIGISSFLEHPEGHSGKNFILLTWYEKGILALRLN